VLLNIGACAKGSKVYRLVAGNGHKEFIAAGKKVKAPPLLATMVVKKIT
jgi:hypothetical protein